MKMNTTSGPPTHVGSRNSGSQVGRSGRGRGVGRGYGNSRGRSSGRGGGRNGSSYLGRGGRNGPLIRPATQVPQGYLPPYLPGASSMVEQLDKRLLVILRDGRHLVGVLKTFDQFANMVMQDTAERRILVVTRADEKDGDNDTGSAPKSICYQTDIMLGLFIVRGDNVVLMGEVDELEGSQSEDGPTRFVSLEEFELLEDEEARKRVRGGPEDSINWDFDQDLVA